MTFTPRLGMALLFAGQAQKEVLVNEALQALDFLVGAAVEEPPRNAPPSSPVPGQCWIIGTSPSGAWAGKPHHLAGYTAGGWRLFAPAEGMTILVKTSSTFAVFRGGAWDIGEVRAASVKVGSQQVVGVRQPAISTPSGGSTVDSEARNAVTAILAALKNHGLIAT